MLQGIQYKDFDSEDNKMACSWIICLVAVAVTVEATLYDDDYDTYTKAYDYKNAGNFNGYSIYSNS